MIITLQPCLELLEVKGPLGSGRAGWSCPQDSHELFSCRGGGAFACFGFFCQLSRPSLLGSGIFCWCGVANQYQQELRNMQSGCYKNEQRLSLKGLYFYSLPTFCLKSRTKKNLKVMFSPVSVGRKKKFSLHHRQMYLFNPSKTCEDTSSETVHPLVVNRLIAMLL